MDKPSKHRSRSRSPKKHHRRSRSRSHSRDRHHHRRSSHHRPRDPSPSPALPPVVRPAPDVPLTPDDFSAWSLPFSVWLLRTSKQRLLDLPKDDAKKAFSRFTQCYNEGRTAPDLVIGNVAGLSAEVEAGRRTSHVWGMRLSAADEARLESLKSESLRSQEGPGGR